MGFTCASIEIAWKNVFFFPRKVRKVVEPSGVALGAAIFLAGRRYLRESHPSPRGAVRVRSLAFWLAAFAPPQQKNRVKRVLGPHRISFYDFWNQPGLATGIPYLGGRDEWKFSFEVQHTMAVHFAPTNFLKAISQVQTVGGSFFFAVATI